MKPYSVDLRQRVVEAAQAAKGSIRQIATWFCVGKSTLTRWLGQYPTTGSIQPKPHAGGQPPALVTIR